MRIKQLKAGYNQLNLAKVRIVARLKFDGCLSKSGTNYVIKYEMIEEDLLQSFRDDLVSVYGLEPSRLMHKSGKTGKLLPLYYLRAKLVYNDLMKYGPFDSYNWRIPAQILSSSHNVKKEFVRCFFDDEGSVVLKRNGKSGVIKAYSINLVGLTQISELLNGFGIGRKLYSGYGAKRNVFGIVISDLKKFSQLIGFSCARKTTKLQLFLSQMPQYL